MEIQQKRNRMIRDDTITLKLGREAVFCGNLILVNAGHRLRCGIELSELSTVSDSQPQMRMQREAAQALRALIDASRSFAETQERSSADVKNGKWEEIVCVSGYRSRQEQEDIFERSLCENGQKFTETFVAYPDCSEHQTGLAMDLARGQEEIDFICPVFPYDGVFGTFRRLAPEFGYVERYPAGMEERTGIGAEPWHFRYVGKPHAKIMTEYGMVLEEYVEWIRRYRLSENPFRYRADGKTIRIGYRQISGKETVLRMTVPENGAVSISGDNEEGVIVTVEAKER